MRVNGTWTSHYEIGNMYMKGSGKKRIFTTATIKCG